MDPATNAEEPDVGSGVVAGAVAAEADPDPESVARSICLSQLERAPKTRGQLAATMRRRLVPDDAAERVLDRLEAVGLVDDRAFAMAWVTSRHGTRGLAGRSLRRELRERGVEDDTIAAAVGQLDEDIELATARELGIRKQRSMSSLPVATQQRRLVALLGRKGYPAATCYRVAREVAMARDPGDLPYDLAGAPVESTGRARGQVP